jgi:murein DD-endopeptidase MepM/ murein hydrolase activator NlpD
VDCKSIQGGSTPPRASSNFSIQKPDPETGQAFFMPVVCRARCYSAFGMYLSNRGHLSFPGVLAGALMWLCPIAGSAEVSCAAEALPGAGGQQAGVALVCVNPDPFAQTVVLNLRPANLADGLPGQSMHVLRPGDRQALRALSAISQPWSLDFDYGALFGAIRGPVEQVPYRLPFLPGSKALVAQLHGGPRSSHGDMASQHAIDFGLPFGSVVIAARSGVVAVVKDGSTQGGWEPNFQGKENLVIVYHSDDTWAVYGHLEAGSISLAPGDRVEAGQQLGKTGKSGMLAGPHLHFAVQMRTPAGLVSLPIRFETSGAAPVVLSYGQRVVAQ